MVKLMTIHGEGETNERLDKLVNTEMVIPAGKVNRNSNDIQYLLLYTIDDGDGHDVRGYEFITGRMNLYKFIKDSVEGMDIHESKVISDTVTFNESISVYQFMKHASKTADETDTFDIEDYNIGDSDDI